MRMRVAGDSERNAPLLGEADDFDAWILFADGFAPSCGADLNGEVARFDEVERFADERSDVRKGGRGF